MTLRLTEEQGLALEALAGSQGISKQEATVRAILEAANCRVQCADLAELSACGRERNMALLDRLAQ